MNDPDKITRPNGNGVGDYPPERLWVLNDFTVDGEPSVAEVTGGLANLKFITATLRRRAKFWCAIAVLGFVAGCGFYAASPPGYQASTTVWLVPGPYENILTAPNNDQAMAETRTVAGMAVRQLGLHESAGSFLATYKVTPVTERVMDITASARSSDRALADANAVAAAFLKFRGEEMEAQQALVLASLDQQASRAQQRYNSINSQISHLQAQPASSSQQSQLKTLELERGQADTALYQFRQAAFGNQTGNGSATAAAVKGSYVLDPATLLAHSRLKPLVLDVAVGLIGGAFLGMAIVVIQALVSDKLRRRDDVAQALGAPVRLSVGPIGRRRWLPVRGRSATRDVEVQRIAAHLGCTLPGSSRGVAGLAVVPVDDPEVPALTLLSLAVSCAKEGRQVVVADLCNGAPVAQLLGGMESGVGAVRAQGTGLVLAVPDRDDLGPVGPLGHSAVQARRSPFTEAVAAACASADLLLTIATIDPSVGAEHLATWATDAVAVVTAGRSSWEKIHGVAELVRLSGTRLVSAVLIGADRSDESLGTVRASEPV